MSKRFSKRFGFEQLEQRKLLAADLAADIMPLDVEPEPTTHCEVASEAIQESEAMDIASGIGEQVMDADVAAPRIQEFDLSDGSDGTFGSFDENNKQETFSFQPETDGAVDIVVASSFGDASTFMEVRDSQGELVSATETESLDGFQTLRIEVSGSEAYELTISTDDGVEGNYQVTVGFISDSTSEDPLNENSETEPSENADDSSDSALNDAIDDMEADVLVDTSTENTDQVQSESISEEPAEELTDHSELDHDHDESGELETDGHAEGLVADSIDNVADAPSIEPALDNSIPQPTTEVAEGVNVTSAPSLVDMHANEIGDESTELDLSTGIARLFGQLESANDVDTFQFTAEFDGTMDLFLANSLADNELELNIHVYDSQGNELLDGATNAVVKLSFDVVQGEQFYVSVSADEGQTGEFALIAGFTLAAEPADDHANEIGADATPLVFSDEAWMATGELETANDQDAFRFTASCKETLTLAMDIASENHQSAAQISVFDDSGQLVVQGNTNDGVDLTFDTIEGVEYQILVDSTNDIPMTFELTAKTIESPISEDFSSALVEDATEDALTDCVDDIANCGDESDAADQFFTSVGENESQFGTGVFDDVRNEVDSGMSRLSRFARRV